MSAARLAKAGIRIPKRIERGPTDILKALASTVKYVPTAPDPHLQDDPYLLPSRAGQKNQFYFAKASGRNTARFLLNRHPEIFFRDQSEPKVLAFLPDEEFKDDMNLTEEDLVWCLDNNDVSNAVIAYHSLIKKGVKLNDENFLRFFEMLCFTNEKKTLGPIEAELVSLNMNDRDLVDMSWNDKGLANKLFSEFKEDLDPQRMYSAMIAGLVKFNQHTTAKQVYDDFKNNHPGQGLYPVAYSSLLDSITILYSDQQAYQEAIDDIVGHMEANSVAPDLKVFNSILKCYRRFRVNREFVQNAYKLINDMKTLDIEPSLFTYECLIYIISRDRGSPNKLEVIEGLLDYINNANILEAKEPRDMNIFKELIHVCLVRENSYNLAKKVHKLYLKKPHFFPHTMSRQEYLERFFRGVIASDKIENTLEFYDANVPANFRPSPDAYDALADALDLYEVDEETKMRIGQDIINFGLADRLKNDGIFRKMPAYESALKEHQDRRERLSERGPRRGV